jgi:retron-type reverse transcriptase
MKRIGNLYSKIISLDNLRLADKVARKGKRQQVGIIEHDKQADANLQQLHLLLYTRSYRTSPYTTFIIREPKEREVYRLPYFPDRITHHAVMNVLEPIFVANFTADTYSCIKGRGIHAAQVAVEKALKDQSTTYCLKLDIRKFYPSVDHSILKALLRRKIKDSDLLWLLDEIIDSAAGLPIGNYLSQYLANFYLSGFDHWIKQELRVKYYFRYADDIVILHSSKPHLHELLQRIRMFLLDQLKLDVKANYQVFPVAARGIDFVGYRFYHTHTRIRKTIKQNFARMAMKRNDEKSFASYMGWMAHAKTRHLVKKITHDCIQRNGYCAARKRNGRRKNKNQLCAQPANRSAPV